MTFDQINRFIIVSETEISIQELINGIRDWEDDWGAMSIPIVANAYGKQDLGGGIKVGITLELINNWRIKFVDRSPPDYILCRVYGGNLVAINDYNNNPICPSAYTQVVIAQSTSATMIQNADIDFIKQVEGGRWKIQETQMIFYKENNEAEVMRFNLYDKNGELTSDMQKVCERRRV